MAIGMNTTTSGDWIPVPDGPNSLVDTTAVGIEVTTPGEERPPQVPWHVMIIMFWVFSIGLNVIVCLVGLANNVIVMSVFYRQGILAESGTVSLFSLAVTDFLILICHAASGVAQMFWVLEAEGVVEQLYGDPWAGVAIISRGKYPLSHIQCWLTAFLAFERCCIVMFPFKVRGVFTPRNCVIAIVCIYIGSVMTFLPLISVYRLGEVVKNNKTVMTTIVNDHFSPESRSFAVMLNPVTLRPIGIIIMVICNVLLLTKVKSSKKWRQSATASTVSIPDSNQKKASKTVGQKEEKLIKTVAIISGIFLFCVLPDLFVVMLTQTKFALFIDSSVYMTLYTVTIFTESVNSSINIVVYYSLSTNFRNEFRKLFGLDEKSEGK